MKQQSSMQKLIDTKAKQWRFTVSFAVLLSLLGGCGTETGNPIIKRPTTPRNIAQDAVEAEFLDLSEALSEQDSSLNALTLAQPLNPLSLNDSSECTGDANNAVTKVTRSKNRTRDFTKRGVSISFSSERQTKTEWYSPLGALSCVGQTLKKTGRLLTGTTENRTGTVQRTMSRTLSSKEATNTDYTRASFNSSGNWKLKFDKIETSGGIITVQKTSEWSLNKTNSLTTSEGESSIETSNATLEGSPLKITIVREGLNEKSKTIDSGRTKTTRKDGSTVELTYESVVFLSTDTCYPSKGKVQGQVTPAPSSNDSPQQFEIDFSKAADEIPEIVFSDGQKVSLSGTCFD